MHEIVTNIHMHTSYSDGTGSHQDIVRAALISGLDAVIVTDHNVWVNGPEKYYEDGDRRVLLLVGEEVHDQSRAPQKNHLLVFGADQEMSTHAQDPQGLLDAVQRAGGLAFIAHPVDPPAPAIGEGDLSWVDWDIHGYSGIELWNSMSELKSLIKTIFHALFYIFCPRRVARGPFPAALKKWDELLSNGERMVAIGGSDAHALHQSLGPIHKTVFPYEFHFSGINTHLLIPSPLTGEVNEDKTSILVALSKGHAFIGYDLPAPTGGFRFTAHGKDHVAWMGDVVSPVLGVTFQIHLPFATECHLLKDGGIVKTWKKRENCTYITSEPGIYRVEVYVRYKGMMRGWIYSNPIYVREK